MSDIKLFRMNAGTIAELTGTIDTIEKSVQILFEKNLEALLGVRFLASEFTTTNGGRIDTLGLDENGCPVILEYKRAFSCDGPGVTMGDHFRNMTKALGEKPVCLLVTTSPQH